MANGGLSDQEQRVVRRLARGLSQADIARRLVLSPKTVGEYRRRVRRRLGLVTTGELIAFAAKRDGDAAAGGDVVDDDPLD